MTFSSTYLTVCINAASRLLRLIILEFSSPFPAFSKAKLRPNKPSLEYCKAFIETNLGRCKEEHVWCEPNNLTLPKRVLDVSGGARLQIVKLLEIDWLNPNRAPYVALSHC